MKGIIVEINGKKAVMLNNKGEYKTIKNQNFKVGEQIVYKKPAAMYYAACACVAVFCMLSASVYGTSVTPVSHVDIDINPSVRIDVNSFRRVIGFTPLNEDGERLIEGVEKGLVSNCIKALVSRSEELGYIDETHPDMEIDVSSRNKDFFSEMEKVVGEISDRDKLVHIELYNRDEADYNIAKASGVSMGRYKAIEEYSRLSGEPIETVEEKMRDKKVYEIKNHVREIKEEKPGKAEVVHEVVPEPDTEVVTPQETPEKTTDGKPEKEEKTEKKPEKEKQEKPGVRIEKEKDDKSDEGTPVIQGVGKHNKNGKDNNEKSGKTVPVNGKRDFDDDEGFEDFDDHDDDEDFDNHDDDDDDEDDDDDDDEDD